MAKRGPRVNVTVTDEQHALLIELAELNGGSAAGYLRQMLDQATPLLRATVPALRMAAQEMNTTREQARTALDDLLGAMKGVGVDVHPDLLDGLPGGTVAPSRKRSRSDAAGGREAHSQPPHSNTGVSTSSPSPRSKGSRA